MTITKRLRRAGLLAALLAAICCDTGPTEVPWSDGFNALFIGNSITFWHDIPSIVEALVDSAGIGPNTVASFARGGWSLAEHWHFGRASELIAEGGWDVVVLQGSAGIGAGRDSLLKYAQLFADEASGVGARTALFMPNPGDSYREYVDEISAANTYVARQINGVLLPVADAWSEVWARDATFQLYDDDVHPNESGSYLAALVIFQHLIGRSPLGLPATLRLNRDRYPDLLQITPEDAAFLQSVAAAVGEKYGIQ